MNELDKKQKSIFKAYIIWALLGLFGGHRYYLGKDKSATLMTIASFFIFTIPFCFWFIVVSLYYSWAVFASLFDYHFYMFPWSIRGFTIGVSVILFGLVSITISLLFFGAVIYGVLRFLIDGFLLKKMVRDYNAAPPLVSS